MTLKPQEILDWPKISEIGRWNLAIITLSPSYSSWRGMIPAGGILFYADAEIVLGRKRWYSAEHYQQICECGFIRSVLLATSLLPPYKA